MASDHHRRDQSGGSNSPPTPVSGSSSNPPRGSPPPYFDSAPYYYETSEEIDWSRPRNSWNINQDYTYFTLFGRVASESFTIGQLLAKPEEFVGRDMSPHVQETPGYPKSGEGDRICVVCEKDEHKERIARLDCGHGYHVYCMEDWLQNWNICPLCKYDALGFPKCC